MNKRINIEVTTSSSWQDNHPIALICYWMTLFVVTIFNGCVVTTSNTDSFSTELSDEFSTHLQTLQERYDLTGSLKTTKMMVRIQEADSPPEELHEMLWYKKTSDGSELLRIQALGGFTDTKGVAIANRKKFLLALLDEQEVYVGKLSDSILHEIFGIDLRVTDVLSAIFANPFLDGRTKELCVTTSGGHFIVTRPGLDAEHTENITVQVKNNEPRVTEWVVKDSKDTIKQRAVFSGYREVDGILRPNIVEIERPLKQTSVIIKISDVHLNVDIDDSHFDFEPFLNDDMKITHISDPEKSDTPE